MARAQTQLYDAQTSREIDAAAMAQMPVRGYELMCRAAQFAFDALLDEFPYAKALHVVCGKGNNGGDGYVLAAIAAATGLQVRVSAAADPEQLQGDAAVAFQDCIAAGVAVEYLVEDTALESHFAGPCEVWVDALLGTGISRAVSGRYAELIDFMNAHPAPILSLDMPSGVDSDTGAICGTAIYAALTTAFITQKIAHRTGPGLACLGVYRFSALEVSDRVYPSGVGLLSFNGNGIALPGVNAYKHQRGRLAIVGSDHGMPGASALAAEAALRAGAGLVSVVTHAEHAPAIIARTPEAMVVTPQTLELDKDRFDLVVLGPGLGRNDYGADLYQRVQDSGLPVVLDADGLHFLALQQRWDGGPLFITPHSGEAAGLLNRTVAEVDADRLGAALALARQYGCAGVLKGAGSVVFGVHAQTRHQLEVCRHGNPGMAAAGMGDVLAGIAGGLLAELARGWAHDAHYPAEVALDRFAQAVALHSAAADLAVQDTGVLSLLASDVTAALPRLLEKLR